MASQTANNAIQLKDIHLPVEPGFWPLAPGWWVLLAILLIGIIWLTIKLMQQAKRRKHQQRILDQYSKLEQTLFERSNSESIAAINIFLRQLAINKYPRSDIASLTGKKWLAFLDKSGNTQEFSKGAGRVLIDGPYRSGRVLRLNMNEFKPLVRGWIKKVSKSGGVGL